MFWTSIKHKLRHTVRIILTYIAYESNLSTTLSYMNYLVPVLMVVVVSFYA